MDVHALPWFILFLPLAAAVVITLFTQRNKTASAALSIAAVITSFVLSGVLFAQLAGGALPAPEVFNLPWLHVGNLSIDFGFKLDPLSLLMLLVVTGVGSAIHIYSYGYMHEDRGFARYFASLSLFTFSMLGIVLAANFVQMFIFWELVGVSSYLLIGHWFERPSAAEACKKAFLTNRVGDFGFLLGILLIWATLGSVDFGTIAGQLKAAPVAWGSVATVAGLLIFCGCVGKSAQFPLHVWLPDAMEGPTPVSALIHAATMVAAGVYMLCRVFFLFTPDALEVIAWIGGITALMAALMAVQQSDIKRILAYSTLSQLGYMVMAVGLGGPTPAMYHLTTHAFFKALLFLGAGSVIHALHHEQDIWKMGGLKAKLPVTFWTFLLATLALCGVPPLSGYFSKDEILALALGQNTALFALTTGVAMLTTFYMFRLVFVAFTGPAKSQARDHAHESPPVMTWPLIFLATLTVAAGFAGIESRYASVLGKPQLGSHTVAVASGLGAFLIGLFAAWRLYGQALSDPIPNASARIARLLRDKFYFDELYAKLIACTQEALASVADWFDRWIIAGLAVRGTHGATELTGMALRLLQTGNLQTYAFLLVVGVVVVLYVVLR
jgi:NADH-quinone oxidoreductase subunit L